MLQITPSLVETSLLMERGIAGEVWSRLRASDLEINRQLQNMESAWIFLHKFSFRQENTILEAPKTVPE